MELRAPEHRRGFVLKRTVGAGVFRATMTGSRGDSPVVLHHEHRGRQQNRDRCGYRADFDCRTN